ncbi:Pkinase-domain-containing protein [Lactarius akahatsu]|uniref:Pkinase-domain-containing protein n=1 Tax=Lactarius akahatsu TaxID=416441 RepID=A0AAD4L4Y6_9AGAM|nr:Pkinase-domain-containing protein [Lactarius akahatsu]
MDSLQIPDNSLPGPSRQNGAPRPASVSTAAASSPLAPPPQPSRKRASHTVASSTHPDEQQQHQHQHQPPFRDIYAHPAAVQYAASHPRRAIPKFGPYLLLQTLGEGEFGKVKLGLHTTWAEEVAVKLIKRNNIDSALRMSKVEREIEVLRMLKHPNIVRLYDVIETDKYIGIILDYASGGELFDHILAHRYLKEKDACRLFAQLISGVWYIHQRKIVHRDLKLENLLLDRNRNVIITDFGFANRFEHRTDDLMQTSCGSPCYAAPELVISEGAYVGSAVDIWSCGVILYAMLAGYLPFDDDPANPEGDNINLLYKYIVNTPLSFPDYISPEARDLLSIMLQPDPQRRADLSLVMQHSWLGPYAYIFDKTIEDVEASAIESHKAKRQAYQRQMRNAAQAAATDLNKVSRSQSAKNDVFPHASVAVGPRSHSHVPEDQTLYETSADIAAASQAQSQTRRGYNSTIVMPTQPSGYVDDDPFAQSPANAAPVPIPIVATTTEQQQRPRSNSRKEPLPPVPAPVNGTGSVRNKATNMRHTIQVEYGQPEPPTAHQQPNTPKKGSNPIQDQQSNPPQPQPHPQLQPPSPPQPQQVQPKEKHRRPSVSAPRPLPPSPGIPPVVQAPEPPVVTVNAASPPPTPSAQAEAFQVGMGTTGSVSGSASSKKGKHVRGLSIDKMGLGKIFGPPAPAEATHSPTQAARSPSEGSASNSLYTTISKISGSTSRRPSTLQVSPTVSPTVEASSTQTSLLSPDNGKKNRRSTLSVMVEPLARIKVRPGRGSTRDPETPSREKDRSREPSERQSRPGPHTSISEKDPVHGEKVPRAADNVGHDMPASTSKARKVMQWFRSRSKGRSLDDDAEPSLPLGAKPSVRDAFPTGANASSASVNAVPVYPADVTPEYTNVPSRMGPPHPQRTASTGTEGAPAAPSFAELVRRHVAPPKGVIRTHHGAVSQATVTTGVPIEVMRHVRDVLVRMGVEVQVESDYKYRCVRTKRRRAVGTPSGFGLGLRDPSASTGLGLAAFTLIGSAASNGVDKRGLPLPSQSTFGGATGGMLKGLLMRRQSSQVSGNADADASSPEITPSPILSPGGGPQSPGGQVVSPGELGPEPVYGDPSQDQGDEVRFYVELTKLDGLKDTYSIDIRRLKGHLRSYKFLYDYITQHLELQR